MPENRCQKIARSCSRVKRPLNDNRNPFLVFIVSEAEGCHDVGSYDMIAKKQRENFDFRDIDERTWEGLTEKEKD